MRNCLDDADCIFNFRYIWASIALVIYRKRGRMKKLLFFLGLILGVITLNIVLQVMVEMMDKDYEELSR